MNDVQFHVAATGLKGSTFLEDLRAKGRMPERVYSYAQGTDASGAYNQIEAFCDDVGVELVNIQRPELAPDRRTFFVGWQFLFKGSMDKVVVFHDSLLPEFRGFAPTATALIAGKPRIGVTAFRPDDGVDTGPVYLQDGFDVTYPMPIADAFERQAAIMAKLADQILASDAAGTPIQPQTQDESRASYSIWRDALDFDLDPAWNATEIVRRIYALGYPYQGARLRVGEETLSIVGAVEVEDLNFEVRDPGKVWTVDPEGPVMICGSGMVKLTEMRREDGSRWTPPRLRVRFERPH